MISYRKITRKGLTAEQEALTWESAAGWFPAGRSRDRPPAPAEALKLSAFYRAIDLRTDSIGKFPVKVKRLLQGDELADHYLGRVLWERPNEAMTPFVYKKLVEYQRLVLGNAYVWIYRDRDGRPAELLPLPPGTCQPRVEPGTGKLWYIAQDPKTHELYRLDPMDILHYKGFSTNGIEGVSILTYAARTLAVGGEMEEYQGAVYRNGGHPAGVLATDTDLSNRAAPDGAGYKDRIRQEWERIHGGAGNAFRVAVLDNGLKFQSISMSNTDAQFVESKAVTVEDIARYTGVPMHKLFTGKQAYNSNEANSIDYVKDTLQPSVVQYEEEDSRKLLTLSERKAGLWLPRNMMAELRGDTASRREWYKSMREAGAMSVNEIRALEDLAPVTGGDAMYASLNYVPLADWPELSRQRAAAGKKEETSSGQ